MFRQMEKLIELLNEYEEKYRDFHFVWDWNEWREFTEFEVAFIISKKFWFIKWLVENEKIDVEKVYNNSDYPMVKRDEFLYEWLLMLLSIQDEPIEFLVSILK